MGRLTCRPDSRPPLQAAAAGGGEPDGELAPFAQPAAPGRDAPAVHLGERLDQRQPDAQPPSDRASVRSPWANSSNICGELLGRDADAVVPDA